jgi:hypothetical protein
MTERMQLNTEQSDPAPDAKNLVAHLLRRNLLWVDLIKEKSARLVFMIKSTSNHSQARSNSTRVPGHIRQALCYSKQTREALPHSGLVSS